MIKESETEALGIQLGDKVIKIDGKNCVDMTEAAYCDLMVQIIENNKQLRNIVISRADEQLAFDLKNEVLIE